MSDEKSPSRMVVLGTVVFYMFSAISMTLLNKRVLSGTPMPVFLLFCQTLVAVVLLAVTSRLNRSLKVPQKFDIDTAKGLIPLVAVNITGLIFNNYCLQYVDASFHQVARGLVLPFTIIVSVVGLSQYPSPLSFCAALIVTLGFFSGVLFDPDHASSTVSPSVGSSAWGITFGVISSITSAFHAILIKRGLAIVDGSAISLAYYNNIMSTIALVPLVFITGEARGASELLITGGRSFFYGAAITGVFGFLISLASFLSIKVTSPVTHMISSAARGVLQTVLAAYFFHDILSPGRIIGIFLIISGSIIYVYSKTPPNGVVKDMVLPLEVKDRGSPLPPPYLDSERPR